MDKKLFDKCLSVVKSRIRKLTMDKSNIQIAIDNYRRDYEKALKQLMKLNGLEGGIKVRTLSNTKPKELTVRKLL